MRNKTEEFLQRLKDSGNWCNEYDYSKVSYTSCSSKIIIICPIHGEYSQTPSSHLSGHKCVICSKRGKLNTDMFISRAKEVHGNEYDYSKSVYKNSRTKIIITCPVHGDFLQNSDAHINKGTKCNKCRFNFKNFLKKASSVHGDKYDYSLLTYVSARIKVKIICPTHGEFEQTVGNHLYGYGCARCGGSNKKSNFDFITRAKEVHGDLYDYSEVIYMGSKFNVRINCRVHGFFDQVASTHLSGSGCMICGGRSQLDTSAFIKRSKEVHGDLYDYSKSLYITNRDKLIIICKEHGEFHQAPSKHFGTPGYKACGCPVCSGNNLSNTDDFTKKAKVIHGNQYNYSKVNYTTAILPIIIECHIHGDFNQSPNSHLNGSGCPTCSLSKGEFSIMSFLDNNNIIYYSQHKFHGCVYKKSLFFDFYLPNNNICIEFDGKQHFESIKYFGGDAEYNKIIIRDTIKNEYCRDNNIKLIRIPYTETGNIENILYRELFI